MHVEFAAEGLHTGNALQDRELYKLIDSRRFPLIAADLRELTPEAAPGRYAASGDITFVGRKRSYAGAMAVTHDDVRVTIEGELTFDIRDFGITPPRILMAKVYPDVKVRVRLVAAREN